MKMQKRKRLWRGSRIVIPALVLIILLPSLIGLTRVVIACRMWETPTESAQGSISTEAAIQQITQTIPDYARPEDSTYLTLPEWYVVYSLDEYAAFIAQKPPSQFPYWQSINQFWDSWVAVCEVMAGRYPLNGGQQLSNMIVGLNFTTETLIRGAYESTLGRLTEWLSTSDLTEEDAYNRQVAKEYGQFIHMIPWFDFPFGEKLRGLWSETTLWGPNPIRKWERKFVLSADYGIKAIYAWVIKSGADAVYGGPDDLQVYAVVAGLNAEMRANQPELKFIQPIDAKRDLVTLTRFEIFTQIVPGLTRQGLRFVEIAGNDEILVTFIAPQGAQQTFDNAEVILALPLPTQPELTRVAARMKVSQLHLFLQELVAKNLKLEHIYDY